MSLHIDFSSSFNKKLNKAPTNVEMAFRSRLKIFIENPQSRVLNNHALKGKLSIFRSINITGDWRALYTTKDSGNTVIFETLGTHSQLYK